MRVEPCNFRSLAEAQCALMQDLLIEWVSINSGSNHRAGLEQMLAALKESFEKLPAQLELVPCLGEMPADVGRSFPRIALRVCSDNSNTEKPILLNGHYDTVYSADDSFQKVDVISPNRLRGPGVTDMKGGLVVLLTALQIWESSPYAGSIAWEVLITPDEELGSSASEPLLKEAAERCSFGLVYESAYPDGAFVRTRKGSGVYSVMAKGRAAHVGRNYAEGRNAILGLAKLSRGMIDLTDRLGLIANLGKFVGGGALNVVPELATTNWNIRASDPDLFIRFESELSQLIESHHKLDIDGVRYEWQGGIIRPPKTVDALTQALFDEVAACASRVGLPVSWRDTGGGSDGSNLASYGLPNIDNLGVRGGEIHSRNEFVELESLPERVALTLEIFKSRAEGNLQGGLTL